MKDLGPAEVDALDAVTTRALPRGTEDDAGVVPVARARPDERQRVVDLRLTFAPALPWGVVRPLRQRPQSGKLVAAGAGPGTAKSGHLTLVDRRFYLTGHSAFFALGQHCCEKGRCPAPQRNVCRIRKDGDQADAYLNRSPEIAD